MDDGAQGCECQAPETCEDSLNFPTCDGPCPAGNECVSDGQACFCDPLPLCEDSADFPACGGFCPAGEQCASDGVSACECEPIPPTLCADSTFPVCDGECPQDLVCGPDPAGDACLCFVPPVECEDSDLPICDGDCPVGTHCDAATDGVVLPDPQLPPEPNPPDCARVVSMYEGQDVHALFPGGIDLSQPQHKCFQNVQRQDDGAGNEIESFDSIVEAMVDIGSGPMPVMLTGPVTVVVNGKTGNTTGTFDTEIVSMSLTGDVGGIPVEIRESPSLPSPGETTITDLGGGLYHIDSFFDVFTELSINSGPFQPQTNEAGRMRLVPVTPDRCECLPDPVLCEESEFPVCDGECPQDLVCVTSPDGTQGCVCEPPPVLCEESEFPVCDGECPQDLVCGPDPAGDACLCFVPPVECEDSDLPICDGDCPVGTHCDAATDGVVLPDPQLPPEPNPPDCARVVSMYEGQDVHALFPGGIDLSQPQHKCFQNVQRQDDGAGNEIESFDSIVEAMVDIGSGPMPVMLTGPVTVVVNGKTGNTTGTFDTEIVSMSLTGDVGGIPVEIRESPSLPSPGETTITDLGGGLYHIDSFFDVFTELSINCGGFCPAGEQCASDGVSACECGPIPPTLCADSTFPVCDGECPVGEQCVDDGVSACECEPIPPTPCVDSDLPRL